MQRQRRQWRGELPRLADLRRFKLSPKGRPFVSAPAFFRGNVRPRSLYLLLFDSRSVNKSRFAFGNSVCETCFVHVRNTWRVPAARSHKFSTTSRYRLDAHADEKGYANVGDTVDCGAIFRDGEHRDDDERRESETSSGPARRAWKTAVVSCPLSRRRRDTT